MYIVLLAGGSGKRLWPLSNDMRSKQFLKIYQGENQHDSTMICHIFQQIRQYNPSANMLVSTNNNQIGMLKNILNDDIDYCIEPERRDTFPAIGLALSYLHDIKHVLDNEVVITCPVDIDAEPEFFRLFMELERIVCGEADFAVIGIKPDYSSNQFAYVLPQTTDTICLAEWYKEKPKSELAKLYIEKGALWSGGVYAFKLGYMIDKIYTLTGIHCYKDLYINYKHLQKRSFAYTIAEKEEKMRIIRYKGKWRDLGNWRTFSQSQVCITQKENYVIKDKQCSNVRVINELHIPILCINCKDMIIAASAGGILVSSIEDCTDIKPYVEQMSQQAIYAEKTWGSFLILDMQKESLTIKITLFKGSMLNYHSHNYRSEIWTIISGRGKTVINGVEKEVQNGDVIKLPVRCKHTVIAISDMKIMEVQIGEEISNEDKEIYVL